MRKILGALLGAAALCLSACGGSEAPADGAGGGLTTNPVKEARDGISYRQEVEVEATGDTIVIQVFEPKRLEPGKTYPLVLHSHGYGGSRLKTADGFVQRLIEEDIEGGSSSRLKRMNIHMIGDEERMRALGATSKMNAELDFLLHLKSLGQDAADAWLTGNWSHIGQRSTIDLRRIFLAAQPSGSPSPSAGPGGPDPALPRKVAGQA